MISRRGKIARLPRQVREELNRRLQNGVPGRELVGWLNGLPEVKAVLEGQFGGVPISEKNLSEWRRGGFQDCLVREKIFADAQEMSTDTECRRAVKDPHMQENLATLLALRHADLLMNWNGEVTRELRRKLYALSGLSRQILALRRTELQKASAELKERQSRVAEHGKE